MQTICVRLSCKGSASRGRPATACRGGSCRFRKRRASFLTCSRGPCDVGAERQRNNKLFSHSSYFRVPRSESGLFAVRAKVTKYRRHGRDRGEMDSCARPAIHWRANARGHARAILAEDDGTLFHLVLLCTRPTACAIP